MNIQVKKKNLFSYSIYDYYSTKNKKNFNPYLWTSAYGLLRLLKIKKNLKNTKIITDYINTVHDILGKHTYKNNILLSDIIELEWYDNLTKEERSLVNKLCLNKETLMGSLRIGKFEQDEESSIKEKPGIYLHYCTKWAYALIKTSQMLGNNIYLYQSANMMLTMCEKNINSDSNPVTYPRKMEQDLEKPEQSDEIGNDPLDVFIILLDLIYNFIKYEKNTKVKELYINLLIDKLLENIPRITEYNEDNSILQSSDQLGIGFLLVSSLKLRILINKFRSLFKGNSSLDNLYKFYSYNKFMKLLKDIYLNCVEISSESFKEYADFTKDVIHSSAYRWLGISIGLRAIKYLKLINDNKLKKMEGKRRNNKKNIDLITLPFINSIMNKYETRTNIHNNFNKESYNKEDWNDNLDINIVTYLYSKNPIFSL